MLNLLLTECCGNNTPACWRVDHDDNPVTDVSSLSVAFGSLNADIFYPVIVDVQDDKDNMIGLIPPTGVAFVVPKDKGKSFPKKLLMSVFEAWPVLILTLLLSILAGIVLWITVRRLYDC